MEDVRFFHGSTIPFINHFNYYYNVYYHEDGYNDNIDLIVATEFPDNVASLT